MFQAIVTLVIAVCVLLGYAYFFFLRKESRLTDQERDQIQKEKWEQRQSQVQNV